MSTSAEGSGPNECKMHVTSITTIDTANLIPRMRTGYVCVRGLELSQHKRTVQLLTRRRPAILLGGRRLGAFQASRQRVEVAL